MLCAMRKLSRSRFRLGLWVVVGCLASPTLVGAQASPDGRAPSEGEARTRAARALDCAQPLMARLQSALRLLREAQSQLNAAQAQARVDAARTIVTLEQRIDDVGEALRACVPHEARLEPRHQVRANTGNDARVAQENAATQVVQSAGSLTSNVHVVVGERVDGYGQMNASDVRSMVSRIGPRLDRCYGQLVERGALQTGQAIVAFTVDASGRVRRVRVEGATISDRRFQQCVRRAADRLRASATPAGGEVRFAYTLRFGPQSR